MLLRGEPDPRGKRGADATPALLRDLASAETFGGGEATGSMPERGRARAGEKEPAAAEELDDAPVDRWPPLACRLLSVRAEMLRDEERVAEDLPLVERGRRLALLVLLPLSRR
jgi:hypothetical protein